MSKRSSDSQINPLKERFGADIKNDAIAVLTAFKKRNQKKLRKLNDGLQRILIPNFSKPLFELTVLSYILSKIVSKPRFLTAVYKERMYLIERKFEELIKTIYSADENKIIQLFQGICNAIRELEKEDPRFIQDLITKGNLKTAATVYAQGISLGIASEITKIDKQDILNYAGRTMMFDRIKEEKDIQERIKVARRLVKG